MQIETLLAKHNSVLDRLNFAGHEAYIVGGAVRDLLLGIEPKDIDITTAATPNEVATIFEDVDLVGAHFGVSLVKIGGVTIEVATFRTDGSYSDGRRPDEVKYTKDVQEDVLRRDFTINGLLMDRTGKVHDLVFGMGDLRKHIIRTIGKPSDRFQEDPVRMLRAIRFMAKLGFNLETHTMRSIMAFRRLLQSVAPERIGKELVGILLSGNAARGIAELYATHLNDQFLPELTEMALTSQNPKHHPEGNVMTHTLKVLSFLPPDASPELALAALLHDVGKPSTFSIDINRLPTFHDHETRGAIMANNILRRLKFSNETVERVRDMVAQHMRFRVLPEMRLAKQLRFIRQPHFNEMLTLHRMDASGGSGNLYNYQVALNLLMEAPPEVLRPERLVNGHDLIKWGMTPGPFMGEVLEALEDAQLEGGITTREEAYRFWSAYTEAAHLQQLRR